MRIDHTQFAVFIFLSSPSTDFVWLDAYRAVEEESEQLLVNEDESFLSLHIY